MTREEYNAWRKAYRHAHPEKTALEYKANRERYANRSPERVAADREKRRARYYANRKKYVAIASKRVIEHKEENKPYIKVWDKVQKALKRGKLEKKPCEMCGDENSQAHHCDYAKPLEVMWLCRRCHADWHMVNEPLNRPVEVSNGKK